MYRRKTGDVHDRTLKDADTATVYQRKTGDVHDPTLTDTDIEKGKYLIRFLNSSLHFADSRLLS